MLLLGDCLEQMKQIPDQSVDMCLTDPPYGTTACKWDSVIPFHLMWREIKRVMKPDGAICLFGSEPFSSSLRMSNINNFKYDWIWQKSRFANQMLAKKQPLKIHEIISVFSYGRINYNPQGLVHIHSMQKQGKTVTDSNGGGTRPTSYLQEATNYPRSIITYNSEGNTVHPTQKPTPLLTYLIKTYTNEGQTVLDFTMGSGSTGVACINTKRNFIGIEMDEFYFKIASERIGESSFEYEAESPNLFSQLTWSL